VVRRDRFRLIFSQFVDHLAGLLCELVHRVLSLLPGSDQHVGAGSLRRPALIRLRCFHAGWGGDARIAHFKFAVHGDLIGLHGFLQEFAKAFDDLTALFKFLDLLPHDLIRRHMGSLGQLLPFDLQ